MIKNKTKKYDAIVLSSKNENNSLNNLIKLLKTNDIPNEELISNLGLFLSSKPWKNFIFYEIYKLNLSNHGSIIEFGVRWGQTLNLLVALRGLFEPYNRHRKIYGFDTFSGFKGVTKSDGNLHNCKDGSFGVSKGYEKFLENLLSLNESLNPMGHIKKFELIKGDANKTIPKFLNDNPHLLVSLAILDFDIYKPTKTALKFLKKKNAERWHYCF